MDIKTATEGYEAWLGQHTTLVAADLAIKHEHMMQDPFLFLRATFYRWAQLWPEVCTELAAAPTVLAVGDLHIENFGTWRDIEGRLVWGINDFDEVYPMPYTIDLVRLGTSTALAIEAGHLGIGLKDACQAILGGFADGLKAGGRPVLLEEANEALRAMALGELRAPKRFWKKMDQLPLAQGTVPGAAKAGIEGLFPAPGLGYRIHTRVAGNGSLGHQRFVALSAWHAAQLAREAKALVPSAYAWAQDPAARAEIHYQQILDRAVRCPDPFVRTHESWIVRRLSPDCSRIELAQWPKKRDEKRLLYAMGWETANVQLGTPEAITAVQEDLTGRPKGWLRKAVKRMAKATRRDWKDWKRASKKA